MSALVTFLVYMVGVFALAWAANRLLQEKEFLSEYFLGSRGLGVWAFALTFAATSASGGSFTGFPAKIYTHGWILALWIASYMVVPLCQMGFMGKRINQIARKTNAITVPDILRDRFESPSFGLIATLLMIFFLSFNLVAQFKAGSLILQTLLDGVQAYESGASWLGGLLPNWTILQTGDDGSLVDGGYLLCLLTFGVAVIVYTTYGGFHAVVWTDVMQGVVMVLGVLIMLPLALHQVGGLGNATREMAEMTPPRIVNVCLNFTEAPSAAGTLSAGSLVREDVAPGTDTRLYRLSKSVSYDVAPGEYCTRAVEIVDRNSVDRMLEQPSSDLVAGVVVTGEPTVLRVAEYGADLSERGAFVGGPGPVYPSDDAVADPDVTERDSDRRSPSSDGFLPLGVAISFFFMWAISGAGQPQFMVRLMAFKDSTTLRRAVMTVTIYYSLIYFPLVIIFCCARILMPGMEGQADAIMPRMAVLLTENVGMVWLAGLLVAAPFAAIMSTVDSFLLVISSAVVRDLYQRNINPEASEKTVKRLSYLSTLIVGTVALLGAVNPPQFLQDIIVYVGSGLAACFLFPVLALLYWPRANMPGCLAGMLGGFAAHLGMHVAGWFVYGEFVTPYLLFGFSPVVVGLFASLACVAITTPLTPPPPAHLVRRYFYRESGS